MTSIWSDSCPSFWARIPRRLYVGHDNLKVRVYSDRTRQRQNDGV